MPGNVTVASPKDVREPLMRVRALIRRYVCWDGFLSAGFLIAAAVVVSALLDLVLFRLLNVDLVLDAPRGVRAVILVLALVAVFVTLMLGVVLRLRRQFSDSAVALVLEKRFPDILGDRLITAVELTDETRAAEAGYSLELIRRTRQEATERMEQVPVERIFDWRRLRRKAIGLGLLTVLPVAVLGTASLVNGHRSAAILDTASIWAERNVLLRNTPWPRASYLEVLSPGAAEVRVARDAPPPEVRVRAAEYVLADRRERLGWRPVRWTDLATLGIAAPDTLTVSTTPTNGNGPPIAALTGAALTLPRATPTTTTVELAARTLDETAALYSRDHPELRATFENLDELCERASQSRIVRRLNTPDAVVLTYTGFVADSAGATRGQIDLTRAPGGDYIAELGGLKESITYTARARNFRTEARQIVLVPPPLLTRLFRIERQPAYLHHLPPIDEPAAIQTLRQLLPEQDLSVTGERSVCTVPAGTELELVGLVDKPLAAVEITPQAGTVPTSVEVAGDTFTVRFQGPTMLQSDVAFDLILVDTDGVSSRRPVTIQVIPDLPPTVEIAAEGLRRLGSGYLCTPRALVPLVDKSLVRDDHGLAAAEFQFSATRLESAANVNLLVQTAAAALATAPLTGPEAAWQASAVSFLGRQIASTNLTQSATLPLPPFERAAAGRTRETLASLQQICQTPLLSLPPFVTDVKFGLDGDAFDLDSADGVLERQGRRMRVADTADIQPRYRVEVNVVATDTNVLTGPKQGRNLETLRLNVIPEADLLAEITKDEEAQTAKFDEALRRLREAQAKLAQLADRLVSSTTPDDVLLAARVRAEDILQDAAKARDLVASVATEYGRLTREVRLNRVDESVPRRFETVVIQPIEQVLANEYRATEQALVAFRESTETQPAPLITTQAQESVATLIQVLEGIRRNLGDAVSEAKLRDDLKRIIDRQRQVSAGLESLRKLNRDALFAPELAAVEGVTVPTGATVNVSQTIDWRLFDKGELKIRFTPPPGGEIRVPDELTLTDEKDELEFQLTAGDKPGTYDVIVVPAVGQPVTIAVTVTAR